MTTAALERGAVLPAKDVGWRLWGMSALEIHDAYWRVQGVAVVRPGEALPSESHVGLFLLLDRGVGVLIDFSRVLDKMGWLRPRLCIVRPKAAGGQMVDVVPLLRCGWTKDAEVARAWSERGTWRSLKSMVGRSGLAVIRARGRLFGSMSETGLPAMMDRLAAIWSDPTEGIPGLKKVAPGVFGMVRGEELAQGSGRRLWLGRGRHTKEAGNATTSMVLADVEGAV